MTVAEFVAEFRQYVVRFGWHAPLLPSEVLDTWEQLIQQCEDSYQWSIYEYTNDLAIRDLIESLLEEVALYKKEGFEKFQVSALRLDKRFMELLDKGPRVRAEDTPWWRTRLPPYAGREFVEDVRSRYGTEIEERE